MIVDERDICVECNGEGYRGWRCTPATCGWCTATFSCMYNGCRTPCEDCATGAAWAIDNGFPETIFAIEERRARAACRGSLGLWKVPPRVQGLVVEEIRA